MTKNKDINIRPSKGISIVIRNDFQQPQAIPKKKRKYKRKANTDILKMPTIPSFIPAGDVSYIKPQYSTSSLNRNMMFPGTPQSLPQLPPPPPLPQLQPPPPLPQIMPPPPGAPVNISFDNMFGSMLENILMPREYGFKNNSYAVDMLDDDVMDSLPQDQQDKYIENKLTPQIEKEIKGIDFADEADKKKVTKQVISTRTAKEWGTKHANKLLPYDETRYKDNEYYKNNYISRLQDIATQDSIKTRGESKANTNENKAKARELLKALGITLEFIQPPPTMAEIPLAKATPAKPTPTAAAEIPPAKSTPPTIAEIPPAKSTPPTIAEIPPAKTTPLPVATKSPPPPPPPPPPPATGKGPPPPPPPPPAAAKTTSKPAAPTTSSKPPPATGAYLDELKDRLDDDPEERATKKETTAKSIGTKDGKNLVKLKMEWLNYSGYRENYENNLRIVINDGATTTDNKAKAETLLSDLYDRYKMFAQEDMPKPTTTTDLKIVEPRFLKNEAYKKEYMKRGKQLLKKIRESVSLDDEDKQNIKLIESHFKLFD